MAVYDEDGKGKGLTDSHDDLKVGNVSQAERDAIRGNEPARSTGRPKDVLDAQRKAATGSTTAGAAGDPAMAPGGKKAEGQDRSKLNEKESSGGGFFRREDPEAKADKIFNKFQANIGKKRGRFATIWIIATLIGAGSGTALFGVASGPFQFIQAAKLLEGIHGQSGSDDVNGRALSLARYARFYKKGVPENSRLSFMGRKIADRAEARFNKIGFTSTYGDGPFGNFTGYRVETDKLRGGIFDNMTEAEKKNPEAAARFMEKQFKLPDGSIKLVGEGSVLLPADNLKYKEFKLLTRQIQVASGANGITSAVSSRYAARKANLFSSFNPLKKYDAKVQGALEKRYQAWKEVRRERTMTGTDSTKPAGIEKEKAQGENGPQDSPDAAANEDKINAAVDEGDAAHGGGEAKANFKAKVGLKLAGGTLSLLGVVEYLCLLQLIHENADKIQLLNVILPLERLAVEMYSLAAQLQNGGKDVDGKGPGSPAEQMGWMSQIMADKELQTSFFEAQSIMAETGHEGGVAADDELKVGGKNDLLDQIFIPEVADPLRKVCAVIGNQVASFLLGAASIAAGGIVSGIVGAVLTAIALPKLAAWVTNLIAGDEVDTDDLLGAAYGNAVNYGAFHLANEQAISIGGIPMGKAATREVRTATEEADRQEFQRKDLAYRLFSPEEPRSLIGQVVRQQSTDPATNVARYVGGFFNIGHSFASLFGKQLQFATVGAAPLDYDYGSPKIGYSPADMDNPDHKNPYTNAANAVALLNKSQEATGQDPEQATNDIVKRVKACFGVDIAMSETQDPDEPNAAPQRLWAVSKPVEGQTPVRSTLETGIVPGDATNYHCMGNGVASGPQELKTGNRTLDIQPIADDDWLTIRFFIFDSQTMNSYYCYDGAANNQITKEACTDSGMTL
jgi:hypothetical protein